MAARKKRQKYWWEELSHADLMDVRLCDLGLKIPGTPLAARIDALHEELDQRGFRFRPHYWLSDEWFAPDEAPGFAVPFYLAHPRLQRLEDREMLEVEGGSRQWCMQLLRHETGHAFETAYALNRRPRWKRIFGDASKPYPKTYRPRPFSRHYVLHLDWWYAQSHPCEDFAETFAVWLRPGDRWKKRYRNWPALKKIEYVDELMSEIADQPPRVRSRKHIEPLSSLKKTLREHYDEKKERYGKEYPDFYDRDLRRIFEGPEASEGTVRASAWLRRKGPALIRLVARWTGESAYTINQLVREMTGRARELDLRVNRAEEDLKLDLAAMLTMQTMNYLHSGQHRIPI